MHVQAEDPGQTPPCGGDVTLAFDVGAQLGEGPSWVATTGELLFVDILASTLFRANPASGAVQSRRLAQQIGAVVPRAGGGLLLALENGLWTIDADDGEPRLLVEVEGDDPATRMNDGKCDRAGRFWGGTMAHTPTPGAGSLYRLEPDGALERVLEGVTISNGLGWSPDDRTMYYIDTMSRRVDAFDFDIGRGTIANRRTFVDLAATTALPDGLAVDAEGGVWVAFYGGWGLHRYTGLGELDRVLRLPVANATSCAFGGPELADLYITTATSGLSEAERALQPAAGGVFHSRPGVAGLTEVPFAG